MRPPVPVPAQALARLLFFASGTRLFTLKVTITPKPTANVGLLKGYSKAALRSATRNITPYRCPAVRRLASGSPTREFPLLDTVRWSAAVPRRGVDRSYLVIPLDHTTRSRPRRPALCVAMRSRTACSMTTHSPRIATQRSSSARMVSTSDRLSARAAAVATVGQKLGEMHRLRSPLKLANEPLWSRPLK